MAAIASVRWVLGLRRRKQAFPEAYDADKATAKEARIAVHCHRLAWRPQDHHRQRLQPVGRITGLVFTFATASKQRKACAAAGVVGVTFHDLRGTSEVSALGMHRGGDRDLDRT